MKSKIFTGTMMALLLAFSISSCKKENKVGGVKQFLPKKQQLTRN
ncbi:hypothetical protein [uncultured Mucilaginibacter sp.]|nr:hypothetical protein [uncultured Mucilaginibacter sp.]